MASIYANGSKGHHKFTLTVTETGTSTANNTSSISFSFVLSPVQSGWDWSGWGSKISYKVTINGTDYTGTIPSYNGSSTVTLKSGTQTVAHDANGKKTIYYSFSVTDGANQSYTCGNASKSGTLVLTDIARYAKLLTAPNFSDGQNPTITYSNPAGTAVEALEACISWTGAADIAYRAISKTGSSYTFELTSAEWEALRNATQSNTLTVYFYIRTTIGGEYYGENVARTFSIGDANPIVTGAVVDVNSVTIGLTGDSNKLIKYFSNARATMSATPQKGAAINNDFYIVRNGNNTLYGTDVTFNNVESNVFTFSAEDSRGNVGIATVTANMINYIKLTCNISNNRPDGEGNMTVSCSGNFFNGSFGAVTNTLTVQYRYKTANSAFGAWADMTVTKNGNYYYASASLAGLDYQQTYSFETRAIDKLTTISSVESAVQSKPIYHWSKNDFVFEVPVTFNAGFNGEAVEEGGTKTINGDLNVTGNMRLKGSGNYGNTLLFGDGTYCYISEAADDELTIKATKINLVANGVYVDGYGIPILDHGIWTPALNSSIVTSYTTQYGWYMKMNQTVTVGFFIKATCRSGYNSTVVSISGLPYTPMFSAAGGGMCSGAYLSAGFNFQCFVAETSGSITTRVQPCNNTTADNIGTSASGVFYRSGGGEITLSGTITYRSNE